MLFNSCDFLFVFLPVVVIGFFIIGRFHRESAAIWLCASSLYFFAQWNQKYVWLLLMSITMNYGFGYAITQCGNQKSKVILILSLFFNIALLGYYKYAGFFAETINNVFTTSWSFGNIILPLGISFFTFTQIAFLVDSYRGKAKEYNFIHYILFVTYFPHLIAGPILHHAQMMPQFRLKTTYTVNWENISKGMIMFIIGFAKKMLLADTFAVYAKPVFESSQQGSIPLLEEAWIGVFSYALQLYFDFSGYCDMAIGISLFFNIRLPFNFNSPYQSTNIIDFWRRWHMTLSAFLRDYMYIPLGGNRHGNIRRYCNVMITMLVGGLWHGAGWTFVIWGGLHGLYLAINHSFHDLRKLRGWDDTRQRSRFWSFCSASLTFLAVSFAWVFFRSPDIHSAVSLLKGMIGQNDLSWHHHAHLEKYWLVYFGLLVVWLLPNSQQWIGLDRVSEKTGTLTTRFAHFQWNPSKWWSWAFPGILLAACILQLFTGKPSEFLYFQF